MTIQNNGIGLMGWTLVLALTAAAAQAQQQEPLSIARQGYLFAGGKYSTVKGRQVMSGQLYAEYQIPSRQTSPYPIVFLHGGGVSGSVYMGTPDGREGWAQFFLRKGYPVYVVDGVGRGRAGYQADVYGPPSGPPDADGAERRISPELFNEWPMAHLHTQRPGTGKPGDPFFDTFFALTHMSGIRGYSTVAALNRDAILALLEKIGPAILLTHSQSGTPGWLVADAKPDRVKAVISIEGGSPAFYEYATVGAPEWFKRGEKARPWGLTSEPLTYSPPVASASEIEAVEEEKADGPGLVKCWLQKEPARKLPNLQKVPIVMIQSESSDHTSTDHCVAKYFEQAGVHPTFIRLAAIGIRGNTHHMMLEKNNLEIADVIYRWLAKTMASSATKTP